LFFSGINSLSYLGGSGLVSDFWITLADAGGSLLCLINGWVNPFVRRHPVIFHLLHNVFMVAIVFVVASDAETAGATIALRPAYGRVEFRAMLTVPEVSAPSNPPRVTETSVQGGCGAGNASALSLLGLDPGSLPTPLRFFVLDDSAASRRILEHQLRTHCPSATVTAFGAAEGDLDLCVARATQEADVVIVDQHLEYSESHLGTAILKRMKLMGFRGLMCIRSGDDSEEDRAYYAACGAHCFLGKDLPAPTLLETIVAAYLMHLA